MKGPVADGDLDGDGDIDLVGASELTDGIWEQDGEDEETFNARTIGAIERIIGEHRGERVAVVCHGGVINVVVKDVLESKHPVAPHHASVTRVTASRSGVRSLTTFNEHSWLLEV